MIHITHSHPVPFLSDFLTFCGIVEAKRPKLSQKLKTLPPSLLFEMNGKMSTPLNTVKPKSPQSQYNTLNFFQALAIQGQLFEKKVVKSNFELHPHMDRLAFFRRMEPSAQYLFLLKVFWCHLDFEEMGEDFGMYATADLLANFISYACDQRELELNVRGIPDFEISLALIKAKPILHFMEQMGFWKLKLQAKNRDGARYRQIETFIFTELGMGLLSILDAKTPLFVWNNYANGGAPAVADEEMLNLLNTMDKKGQQAFLATMLEAGAEMGFDIENLPNISIDQLKAEMTTSVEMRKAGFESAFKMMIPVSQRLDIEIVDEEEEIKGNYHFKVAFAHDKKIWRRIVLAPHHTFEDFHLAIQRAIGFANDHLYAFYADGKPYSNQSIECPFEGAEPPYTDEVPISGLYYEPKHRLAYVFDFGDSWEFQITLEKIDSESPLVLAPQIVESKGKAPEQYP